ncbi:MAG: polymer-forming cytoskeletal protein [Anaerolineae bacterium]
MFGRKEKPPAQVMSADKIETIIGATASFNGQLKSEGGIRIDGAFDGVVETAGNIIIGEGAKVNADLAARNISVAGAVRGNIVASGRLEILSTGRVYGDIQVSSFLIDEGGVFRGQSLMQTADEPLMIEAPQPSYSAAIPPATDSKPASEPKPEKQRNTTRETEAS